MSSQDVVVRKLNKRLYDVKVGNITGIAATDDGEKFEFSPAVRPHKEALLKRISELSKKNAR